MVVSSSSPHTRSEQEMQLEQAVTLSFSFSVLSFSLIEHLFFSLFFSLAQLFVSSLAFSLARSFSSFSILFIDSFVTQLTVERTSNTSPDVHGYSRPSQTFATLSCLSISVYASKNSCVQSSVIGCNLTASSDDEQDGKDRNEQGRGKRPSTMTSPSSMSLSLSLSFSRAPSALLSFFVIRLPRACRSLLQGMWSMLCTIMMWNRHKRSLGVVIDCALQDGWTKACGYWSHMSHLKYSSLETRRRKTSERTAIWVFSPNSFDLYASYRRQKTRKLIITFITRVNNCRWY